MRASKATFVVTIGIAAAAVVAPPTPAQESARVVRIERAPRCEEGQDCAKRSQQIVVSPGGKVEILRGEDGDPTVWLGRHGELAREALADMQWFRGAFLGVQLTDLTPELRRHFGVPDDQGVLVASVVEDSAAARAGIEVGDILTGLEGEAIASAGELARAIGKREPGAAVQVELWRDGRLETLAATLDEPTGRRRGATRVFVRCEGDDCEKGTEHPSMFFFSGDGEPDSIGCGVDADGNAIQCEIEVRCEDETCTCTVNGEEKDCDELDGLKTIRLRRHGQQQ